MHVQHLAIEDALQDGNVAEAKRLYAALLAQQPRWADAIRAIATLPDFASFQTLLDE